jgi:hypothetical protein
MGRCFGIFSSIRLVFAMRLEEEFDQKTAKNQTYITKLTKNIFKKNLKTIISHNYSLSIHKINKLLLILIADETKCADCATLFL